ncbi:MAG: hypothetical protein ACYTE8_12860, partial [Planctomycetota bacterium]
MSKKVVLIITLLALLIPFYNGNAQRDSGSSIENPPVPRDETEKKILAVLDDMNENQRRGNMNVPPEDGRVLRMLT